MREVVGDIWDYYNDNYNICIPTNGGVEGVQQSGPAVMGAGVAWQAAERFPEISETLGDYIRKAGWLGVYELRWHIWCFPTKPDWAYWRGMPVDEKVRISHRCPGWLAKSVPGIIEVSLAILNSLHYTTKVDEFILPRPGCGCGGLDWKDVKPLCKKYGDWLTVISRG